MPSESSCKKVAEGMYGSSDAQFREHWLRAHGDKAIKMGDMLFITYPGESYF